jgi:uncharacterized Tic20 family protein
MNNIIDFNNDLKKEEKTWGMLCHLLSLSGLIIPLGGIIGPLVMWLIKKDESNFVDVEGKESLNFQLTLLIGVLICIPLAFIIIGVFLAFGLMIIGIIFPVIGAVKSNEGKNYKYPYSIKFIS